MNETLTIFRDDKRLLTGDLREVLTYLKAQQPGEVLIFDDQTGRQRDFDLSGTLDEVMARELPAPAGPGRPKLGVTAREVTLLPRHWDWLAGQPGGASAALRRIVEAAMREAEGPDRVRRAQQATAAVAERAPRRRTAWIRATRSPMS